MQRHWLGHGALHVFLHRAICGVKRIGFRRQCQVHGSLGQRQIALRHADEIHCVARRHAQRQRLRVCQADVFHCHAHQPPGNVQRIFAGLQHARQPVQRRIGIAVAH